MSDISNDRSKLLIFPYSFQLFYPESRNFHNMSLHPTTNLVSADENWDSIVAQGWLVVLSTTQFTVLISAYTFAFVFLSKRLFRVWTLLIFLWLPETRRERSADQLRVAAVNMRTPTDVLSESISWRSLFRRKGVERKFALAWVCGAVVCMGLGLASTYWLTLFPVSNGEYAVLWS